MRQIILKMHMIEAIYPSGSSLRFSVYQGSSGCAVGSMGISTELNEAITQFGDLLKNTQPSDYIYEGYYMDANVKIRQGIQNGEIICEELDIDDI